MGVAAALALLAANERHIVHAFRKERALDSSAARSLRELGLSDSRTLRQMVVATVVCRAGPQRYFLDETVWAHRRQLRWRTVARTLVVLAIVAAGAALLLVGCSREAAPKAPETPIAQHQPAPSPPAAERLALDEGTFGFADAEGSELLALDSLVSPVQVRWAVCAEAAVHRVAYARRQARQPAGNGRQVRRNFANEAGDVFRVTGGAAQDDGTCYLTADSGLAFSANRSVAAVGAGNRACDPDWLRLASQAKGRTALHCWPLGGVGPDVQVIAMEFAVVDTSALASLVLAVPGRLVFQDFPATYKAPGQDIWRVDDEGHLSPTTFTILFIGRLRGTWFMGVTWAGGEGEDDYLLVADSADAFRTVKMTYRYWAPN